MRAVEKSELIAIRRQDFFAILRKEYELAGKLLWRCLGVLADRLDQTSRDLSTAKEELAAEDISEAVAEESEPGSTAGTQLADVEGLARALEGATDLASSGERPAASQNGPVSGTRSPEGASPPAGAPHGPPGTPD